MKITEVVNFPTAKRRLKKLPRGYNWAAAEHWESPHYTEDEPRVARHKDVRELGTGSFASTYVNKNRPHDVRKISMPTSKSNIDGFYWYALALSKSKDAANPYFPKIRNLKTYTSNRGTMYSVQMERLFEIWSLDESEVMPILVRIFGNEDTVKKFTDDADVITAYDIVYAVEAAVSGNPTIVDKHLLNAAKLIRSIRDKKRIETDIHDGNIMVRRTSVGPQIVITDPLSI